MKAITLRNLPPELARTIEREAVADGTSLNRTVIRLLERATGTGSRQPAEVLHRDLDHLSGTWSDAEADAFDAALAVQREIDPELWK